MRYLLPETWPKLTRSTAIAVVCVIALAAGAHAHGVESLLQSESNQGKPTTPSSTGKANGESTKGGQRSGAATGSASSSGSKGGFTPEEQKAMGDAVASGSPVRHVSN